MPSVLPQRPVTSHYIHAPPTREQLDYAALPVIDLAKAGTVEGRAALALQTRDAMTTHGFFYVVNHGYTLDQTERIFDIADIPFAQVGDKEKKLYEGQVKVTGSYQGYKPKRYWHIDGGVQDQLEMYSINRDVSKRAHPEVLRPFLPEIEEFAKHSHFNVLHPILKLLALGLELPEDTFVNIHGYSSVGETYGKSKLVEFLLVAYPCPSARFMKYHPRSEDEEVKTKSVWLKGHTDFGTITILYSQPVAGLQILSRDGQWKWVKHVPNALVINTGDAMEFLSGGFYRATIHRVVQPPPDQRSRTRLGAFYFCMCDDNVKLVPFAQSPVLQSVGINKRYDDVDAPTMEQWRQGRTSAYGQSELKAASSVTHVEEEYINGVIVKHYS